MALKTVSDAQSIRSRVTRMRKPELTVALLELIEFVEAQAKQLRPQLQVNNLTQEQGIELLGQIIWRNDQGDHRLCDMDEDFICSIVAYVQKRISRLPSNVSGHPWTGLTMRQWERVLFCYQEKQIPVHEIGYYNKLQNDYLAAEAIKYEQGVSRRRHSYYEEDDTAWGR